MLKYLKTALSNICAPVVRNVQSGFAKVKVMVTTLAVSVGLISAQANAALPASVATTITDIQTNGTALFDLVFPVVAAFVGLVVVIKLFKRFSNKL
jgi:hypothetical protein